LDLRRVGKYRKKGEEEGNDREREGERDGELAPRSQGIDASG